MYAVAAESTVQGCGLCLHISVSRCTNVAFWSRLKKTVNIVVSAIYISHPRTIFGQTVQAKIIKWANSTFAINGNVNRNRFIRYYINTVVYNADNEWKNYFYYYMYFNA